MSLFGATTNPYRISGPTILSYSGGRTSAFMLWQYLEAHGGRLPPDTHVCFANTGCEHPDTLAFVHTCSLYWAVPIVWLEYDGDHYVERRRVSVRSHNAISGFDGLSWELAGDPLLVAGYFQNLQLDPATGRPDRQSRSGNLSHVLIRNREGNFYALRTSARSTLFQVDSRRGLLNYAGKWWDLKVIDRPLESDLR